MALLRVLHSISTFLTLTENWIEPQVFHVPGVEGRVLCDQRINREVFSYPDRDVIVDQPSTGWHWRIQHYLERRAEGRGTNRAAALAASRRWRPQIVHAHFGQRGWQSRNLARRLGIPLVTSFYGYDAWMLPTAEPRWRARYKDLFEVGSCFLVEGPAMRERLIALGCAGDKIRIHRIGVDLDAVPFVARSFSAPFRVAMVGRFVEKKGLVDGLRACAEALARGVDLHVTLVGAALADDREGRAIADELRDLADGAPLAGRVHLAGFLSAAETAAVVRSHQIFLCPSRHAASGDAEGGSPVVLTEAMASGAFCIGTEHCDIPEVIVDGRTGFLRPEADVSGLAQAIVAVAEDPTRATLLARRGREHVEALFSLDRQVAGLESIYRGVRDRRASVARQESA